MQAITVFSILSASVCLVLANDLSSSSFGYGVNDPLTGDVKDQAETRIGDAVAGYYRTLDADGLMRTVNYKADALNGFMADVRREPLDGAALAPTAAMAAPPAPTIALAPMAYKSLDPLAYKSLDPLAYRSLDPLAYAPAAYNKYATPAGLIPSIAPALIKSPYTPYATIATAPSLAPTFNTMPFIPSIKSAIPAYASEIAAPLSYLKAAPIPNPLEINRLGYGSLYSSGAYPQPMEYLKK